MQTKVLYSYELLFFFFNKEKIEVEFNKSDSKWGIIGF